MPWEDPAFYADTPNTKESCSGPISDSPAGKYLWCKKMTLVLKQVRQNYVGVVEPQYKQSNISMDTCWWHEKEIHNGNFI